MNKFTKFMKKQGYYIMMVLCVLLIATVITLSVVMVQQTNRNQPTGNIPTDPDDPDDPTGGGGDDPQPMKFLAPVDAECVKNYQDMVNENGWKMHVGVDYKVAAGTKVVASYTGVVVSAETNARDGLVLVIKYDNGYQATYKGLDANAKLDNNVVLKKDSQVTQGQHIGTVASTSVMCNSGMEDVHLHVEMRDSSKQDVNNYVDPTTIFEVENK